MHHGDRRVGDAGTAVPRQVTGDEPEQRAAVRGRQQRHLAGPDVLVPGVGHLEPRGQVHPQLESVEQAPAGDQFLGRLLDVQDATTGGHPLGVAVGDQPSAAVGVLVAEDPIDDVGHGLEAPVRVPGGPLGLTRGIVHLAHLVHVDERVELGQVNPGERAPDREALTLEAGRGRGHRQHRALGSGSVVWLLDAGQHQDVGNSDRGHDLSFGLGAWLQISFGHANDG